MSLIDDIHEAWGWIGLEPLEVVGENDFGNLIVKDVDGKYWRISPEECYCEVVASNRQELDALSNDQEFLHDWYMSALVSLAHDVCGPLAEGRKYSLKLPALLGGTYAGDNLAIAPLVEIVRLSGDIAKQTKELPDGTQIKLQVVD
jgi:hypothetical protein